jgi:hypothetical protein
MANTYSGGLSLLSSHIQDIAQYFSDELTDILASEQVNASIIQDMLILVSEASGLLNAYS